MIRSTASVVSAIACLSLALAAAPLPQGAAKTLRVYSSLPRTGSANNQTTSMVNGIRMAIDVPERGRPDTTTMGRPRRQRRTSARGERHVAKQGTCRLE